MAYDKLKTEHVGAKNGGGGYGHRVDVKKASNRRRRAWSRRETRLYAEVTARRQW
jgi:hypothetical protein